MLRAFFLVVLILGGFSGRANADAWNTVLSEARGQTVHFNAWGGDDRINAYIAWVGDQVAERYGVTLKHIKVSDTASVVSRVLAEKTAGRNADGTVDLVWINGENFAAMKRNGLLAAPWAESLPNAKYLDVAGKPTVRVDFTVPTDGQESPWGMAQLVFFHDTASLPAPPTSLKALATWIKANPGRFTYPQPPDFVGTTFLKQALATFATDPAVLSQPVDQSDFATTTAPLWAWLEEVHPNLWRQGRAFPANYPAMRQLLGDLEIDIAFAFNPSEASTAIENGELPDTVRSFVLEGGTIGNTHFVAIPYNASSSAGAKVIADFLISPEAQARKQDPRVWGDPTVLAVSALPADARAAFDALPRGVATLSPTELGSTLPEPHPSWMARIESEWQHRFAGGE